MNESIFFSVESIVYILNANQKRKYNSNKITLLSLLFKIIPFKPVEFDK